MQKIIINGANGFVASHFIRELLKKDFQVIALVRKGEKISAQQRMQQVLEEISEKKGVDFSKLKVYSYSLFDENYSLTQEQIDTIFDGNIQFFHFAASLKFSAKDKNKIFETNVDGLKNSVQFFQKYAKSGSRFIYMSTAYSCGKFSGVFEEKFYPEEEKSHFRNYYEQSKRVAENVMKESIESGRLNGHVVRLSQVVGNNITGVTKTDYGIFDLAKRLYNIASLHSNNTLRIKVDPNGTQNLIPIDKVTEALIKILPVDNLSRVLNLSAKASVQNKTIAHCLNKHLPGKIITDKALKKKDMNSLERMIAVGMSFTGKYTRTNLQFENKNLSLLRLSANNEVTQQSLCKMIEYFIGTLKENHQTSQQETAG